MNARKRPVSGGRSGDLWSDQGGAAVILWVLILAPVLWLVALSTLHFPAFVAAKGVDIRGAVQRAAKAGAYQITAASYAEANPRIDPAAAGAAAQQYLAENLRLDPITLAPQAGSWLSAAPVVQLQIANGPFPQTLSVPGSAREITFPTAGVLIHFEVVVRTPGGTERPTVEWAAARVYQQGGL